MMILNTHFDRRSRVLGLGSIVFFLLLAAGLTFALALHGSSHAFAASFQQATGTTCVQAPSVARCDNQDPEAQGCATDADTIGKIAIKENGRIIGSLERRWSTRCQSWWGRVIDTRSGSQANMDISAAGTTISAPPTFISSQYRILYSPMIFDATPTQQIPSITGILGLDGITTSPHATLPAITQVRLLQQLTLPQQ